MVTVVVIRLDPGSGQICIGRRKLTQIESNPAAAVPESVEASSAEQLPEHEAACAPGSSCALYEAVRSGNARCKLPAHGPLLADWFIGNGFD